MTRRVEPVERGGDDPVDGAVGSGVDHLGNGEVAGAPTACARPRRARWGSGRDRTTFTNTTRRPSSGSSSRHVVARSGHSHATVQLHAAYADRIGSGGHSDTRRMIRRVAAIRSGQAVGSDRSDDASPGRTGRRRRGAGSSAGCSRSRSPASPSTSCCPKVIDAFSAFPQLSIGRVRVDRGRARVRGDQLRHGVDAAAARDANDAVVGDRDLAARGQRAELDPARGRGRRRDAAGAHAAATPASRRRPRRRA